MKLERDPDDADGQTLLLRYPAATARTDDYIRSAVKIEAGAKSALDPHTSASVTPYIAADLPDLDLRVGNVITVEAERTFARSGTRSSSSMACDSGMTGVVSCAMAVSGLRGTTTTRTSSCAMNGQRSGSAIEPSLRTARHMHDSSSAVPTSA
jgi:hypothetical protein